MPPKTRMLNNIPSPASGPDGSSAIQAEYAAQQALYELQPALIRRFLDNQAQRLAESIRRDQAQASFSLPDKVVLAESGALADVPPELREQPVGGLINRLARSDLRTMLRQRLYELEGADDPAVVTSARLVLHALAECLINTMLPAGRSVTYTAAEGEEIPTLPGRADSTPQSAITQSSDAITEQGSGEDGRGELQVPFVPAARRFYLPQWVAFDDEGKLLVNSASEAEGMIASMQSFLNLLHSAVSLAPYVIADPVYQQKRYGMLGQLVNQGRALARWQVAEVVRVIQQRARDQSLNRGLSLSLPYFDDQALQLRTHDFEVIPAGRIMFVPAFVGRAAAEEQAKVAQDTRLSPSTRKYLLISLKTLAAAFTQKS